MDWNQINTIPNLLDEFYLKVEGETIRGAYIDNPSATHWTTLDVEY